MEIRLNVVEKRVNDFYVPNMDVSTLGAIALECEVRGGVNITHPTFILTNKPNAIQYYRYNYVYVPLWKRYYFIDNVTINGNLMYIECSIDVLATWHDTLRNQTFFCTRSESDYDETIVDCAFPAHSNTKTYFAQIEQPWLKNYTDCYYIIGISNGGEQSHIGCNTYYIMDYTTMNDFINRLFQTANLSIEGLADSIVKSMVDPLSYIRSVYWLPFKPDCSTATDDSINFGWWDSQTEGEYIKINDYEDTYTEIEKVWTANTLTALFYEDIDNTYLHYPPFSKYTITAYPFGTFEIPQSLIRVIADGGEIVCRVRIDNISGMGTLLLMSNIDGVISQPHFMTTAQIGVEIPVGEVLQNITGALVNTVSSIQNITTANVAGAMNGIGTALDSLSPQITAQGTCGGFTQIMNDRNWNIARFYQPVNRYIDYIGGACCKNEKISDLKGFAQFENPDCTGEMLREEKEAINTLLATGIFIKDNE